MCLLAGAKAVYWDGKRLVFRERSALTDQEVGAILKAKGKLIQAAPAKDAAGRVHRARMCLAPHSLPIGSYTDPPWAKHTGGGCFTRSSSFFHGAVGCTGA